MDSKIQFVNALEELLYKKTLDEISVSELVNRTNISRRTFYRHFTDKYDLASWYFEQFYEATFGQIVKGATWEEALLKYLDIYEEKKMVLLHAYDSQDINGLRNYDIMLTVKTYETYLENKGVDIKDEKIRFAIDIASIGGTDMIIEWLKNGMKMKKEKLVELLKRTLPNDILIMVEQ
ncbi:MAG: TetR/AcrR family transcriptional regulator C-terminal domain-containing protein [bacterium]|nr:TetR/AcrR family transcriptional regulator C-terminal domain-containing protein [bacterium]